MLWYVFQHWGTDRLVFLIATNYLQTVAYRNPSLLRNRVWREFNDWIFPFYSSCQSQYRKNNGTLNKFMNQYFWKRFSIPAFFNIILSCKTLKGFIYSSAALTYLRKFTPALLKYADIQYLEGCYARITSNPLVWTFLGHCQASRSTLSTKAWLRVFSVLLWITTPYRVVLVQRLTTVHWSFQL